MTDRYTDRLSEYLDGELRPAARAELEEHLGSCADCRRTLAELRAVVALARELPAAAPATDLWPAIRRQIDADELVPIYPVLSPPARGARRRFAFSVPQLAAAAAALMLVSGAAVWLALDGAGVTRDGFVAPVAQPQDSPAARLVSADASHEETVAQLERLLAENRDWLDPVTIAVLESNLRIIDAAIAEAAEALARDPGNVYLAEHLGQTRQKKIDVLRRAADIGRAEI